MREFKRGAMGLVGTGAAPGEGGGTRGRSTAGAALCVATAAARRTARRRSAADGFVSGGWTGTPPVGSSGRAVCPFFFLKEDLCARGPPAILEWWGEACGFRYGGSLARCVCSMRSCLTKNVLIRGVYFLGLFLTAGGGRNDNNGRVCVSLFIMCFPDWWLDQWMGIFISSWELGGEGRGLGAIP
jgi:hypothetical protein